MVLIGGPSVLLYLVVVLLIGEPRLLLLLLSYLTMGVMIEESMACLVTSLS